jgi:hypothetical protein
MDETDKVEFYVEVNAADATDEELDRLTRQLLSEIQDLNVDSAKLTEGSLPPAGTKGDPATLGSIVISTLPAVLPAVVALVQAWSARGQGRAVKFKGKGIEFEGPPEELQKLIESLNKRSKKKK